ncbi:MAG: DNA repair protein RecO [Acidobacteriota bacterium]|nr:DNA repair protein RecO [Acidobacteriota bacterium]
MELHTAEALVLDVRDLGDADRIVTYLTRELGKREGVAKGSRRKHSRFAGQLQPLARASITWVEKPGRDLTRISNVELIRAAGKLQEDLEGILLGACLAEQAAEFVQENESGELHFRLLDSTVEALLAGAPRPLAARYYESWILRLAGIFPPPEQCPQCGGPFNGRAVLPPNGETLLCSQCAGNEPGSLVVGEQVLDFLTHSLRRPLRRLATDPPTPGVLTKVEDLTTHIRRAFLQGELRSFQVLEKTRRQLGGEL